MKKTLLIIVIVILISCKNENTVSYNINNHEYIIKTDSVQELLIYKDTLKIYYLKDKLRSVIINNFIIPEYDTVKDDPFFLEKIYCINQFNEFDAVVSKLNDVKKIGDFKQNTEYDLIENKWEKVGTIYCYFYDYEAMNLDIALARVNYDNFPKLIKKIPKDSLMALSIDQDKEIPFYDAKSFKKLKNQSYKNFVFKYLRDIKIINNGKEKLILAKIIEEEYDKEVYINLKDIISDIRVAS